MATPNPPQVAPPEHDANARHEPRSSTMQCCCGRLDCAVLRMNSSALESVEKDVHTAAQLGQALLARHEAYMADAERDRLDLTARIERLEMDKQTLEAENASKIEENRNLLDQLEMLNNTVSESDSKIKSLEASLLSCQQTVRRLENAAARALDAERHLAMLEEEQDQLHLELRNTKEDARSHAQRCKQAQRGILDMQDQLERMEKEAREERERHVEVMGRMERQREVEKQLDTAAGRLKGAAATKTLQNGKNGSNVVGHFVRDLLQDNANLQLGIAELRELLMNSNDEIQTLREQLMHHQPMPDENNDHQLTLKAELQEKLEPENPRFSQELHIHHHYHATHRTDKRHKKKRHSLGPTTFTPPTHTPTTYSSPTTPRTSGQWRLGPAPATAAIDRDRESSATPPPGHVGHWTPYSDTPSDFASLPSSPRSNKRNSMFDMSYNDSDLPTSPVTSFDPMSPTWRASHSKRPSAASTRSFQALPMLDAMISSPTPPPQSNQAGYRNFTSNTILEVEEDGHHEDTPGLLDHGTSTEDSTTEDSEYSKDDMMPRPHLHRALSHESIMSLSGGLDIHTLKARPSQMTLRQVGRVEAVLTGITAQPTLSRTSAKRSSAILRNQFNQLQTPRAASGPIRSPSPSPASSWQASKWVAWRPWGGSNNGSESGASTPRPDKEGGLGRAPGINQPGAIPGFQQYLAASQRRGVPAKVTAAIVDEDALREGLGG